MFDALFRAHAHLPGATLLESQTGDAPSYLFLEPVSCLSISEDDAVESRPGGFLNRFGNAHEALRVFLDPVFLAPEGEVPPCAGFLAYEFLHHIERIPRPLARGTPPPDALFYKYRTTVALTPGEVPEIIVTTTTFDALLVPWWEAHLDPPTPPEEVTPLMPSCDSSDALDMKILELATHRSSIPPSLYERKVEEIRELIRDGQVYQVNMSRMFFLPASFAALDFFCRLRNSDPASYGAFIQGPAAAFQILSASPELFFRTEARSIRCSPIKGTRPRVTDPGEDLLMQRELTASAKDRAELSMIVDLLRNDIGRCSEVGSVRVDNHAYLKSHAHVHHLVSDISGTLAPDTSLSAIITALFPSGSITGAPKIAAMKYISKLEGIPRGIYTGSIGWVAPQQRSCFSVAIRTAMMTKGVLECGAGGGVVIDSNPHDESAESMHKARGMIDSWIGTP